MNLLGYLPLIGLALVGVGPGQTGGEGTPTVIVEDPNDPVYLIGKEVRCPVCQGMPIADSPAEMAQNMMRQARKMYSEGKTREQILDHFTRAYGDWVLLNPRPAGVNWLVWLLPPLGFLFGLWGIRRYIRSNSSSDAAPTPDTPTDESTKEEDEEDEYLKMVRQEVER